MVGKMDALQVFNYIVKKAITVTRVIRNPVERQKLVDMATGGQFTPEQIATEFKLDPYLLDDFFKTNKVSQVSLRPTIGSPDKAKKIVEAFLTTTPSVLELAKANSTAPSEIAKIVRHHGVPVEFYQVLRNDNSTFLSDFESFYQSYSQLTKAQQKDTVERMYEQNSRSFSSTEDMESQIQRFQKDLAEFVNRAKGNLAAYINFLQNKVSEAEPFHLEGFKDDREPEPKQNTPAQKSKKPATPPRAKSETQAGTPTQRRTTTRPEPVVEEATEDAKTDVQDMLDEKTPLTKKHIHVFALTHKKDFLNKLTRGEFTKEQYLAATNILRDIVDSLMTQLGTAPEPAKPAETTETQPMAQVTRRRRTPAPKPEAPASEEATVRKRRGRLPGDIGKDRAKQINLYLDEGKSDAEIAKAVGVTSQAVNYHRRKRNIAKQSFFVIRSYLSRHSR